MMYKTIEALYDNGMIIFPKNEHINIKKGKILVTILSIEEADTTYPTFSDDELKELENSLTVAEEPLEYQKRIRDEW